MKAFSHHLSYEIKAGIRDKGQMLMIYLFPMSFFVLVASFMTQINPGFKATMIQAMALFAMMTSFLLSMPSTLVNGREAGIFRSYRINGVPSFSILFIPVIALSIHMVIETIIIGCTARLGFGSPLPPEPIRFLAAWIAAAAAFAGLGALIGVVSPNDRTAILLAQVIYIPSIMLGGLMMPQEILPATLRRISLLFPASYAMKAFNGGEGSLQSIAILLATAALAFLLAGFLFDWDPRNSKNPRLKLLSLTAVFPFVIGLIFLG